LSACSTIKSPRNSLVSDGTKRAAINWDVEYYSSKDLALQEIMKTPTEFPILFEEDYYVWERARIFMLKYTKGVAWHNEASGVTLLSSDAENNQESFHYFVSKKMTPDGYRYSVSCLTWDHRETPNSLLNAKNLSRFMRRGELEADLIIG
jgi:hypothetical protein